MKNILWVGIFSLGMLNAQVGINTKTPLGVFHVDSKGDTSGSVSSPNNDGDDVIVDETGQVGIGTINPTAKLDVRGNISIVDGTQREGYVLTSDINGFTSWRDARATLHVDMDHFSVSNTPEALDIPLQQMYNSAVGGEKWFYTGSYFTLDPGKFLAQMSIYTSLEARNGFDFASLPRGWWIVSYCLSTSISSVNFPPNYLLSGARWVSANGNLPNPSSSNIGYWAVNNTSGAPQNMYIWVAVAFDPSLPDYSPSQIVFRALGSKSWVENVLVTSPIDDDL